MHIYTFGSICRGEIDEYSDIDLLAITDSYDKRFNPNIFSIYSYFRITSLWKEGNPFAWHLHTEAKLIYSNNGSDFIKELGEPGLYSNYISDCRKFYSLYLDAFTTISNHSESWIFELSTIFLAIRNFATCFLLGVKNIKDFSRNSALHIKDKPLTISTTSFKILERCRVLSTRGVGKTIPKEDLVFTIKEIIIIKNWMEELLNEVKTNG